MSFLSLNTASLYGIKATGEVDKLLLYQNETISTESIIVEGMPNVKWSLKFSVNDPSSKGDIVMHLFIDSAEDIEWRANYTLHKNGTRNGSTSDSKSFLLGTITRDVAFNSYYPRYKFQIPFQVELAFTYKLQSNHIPRIYNPAKWGLRLHQNTAQDFNIIVGNQDFEIHKFFVAAESPVFKKIFKDDFKEAREGKVTITDFKSKVVKAFFDYCYGQDISTFMGNESDEIRLLYFSDKYDCQTLKPQLETHLISKLSKENVTLYVSTAEKTNSPQLRQACVNFVQNLFNNKESFPSEIFESFDAKFKDDVLRQALNVCTL